MSHCLLSDTPKVDEIVSAWAVDGTPNPQRVKQAVTLAKYLERDLKATRETLAAYRCLSCGTRTG